VKEKKGNKIISWTPFPSPPKMIHDFSGLTPNNRMSIYKSFPV